MYLFIRRDVSSVKYYYLPQILSMLKKHFKNVLFFASYNYKITVPWLRTTMFTVTFRLAKQFNAKYFFTENI